MHVRVRLCGKPEGIVVVPSKLTKIETFRKLLEDKFGLEPSLQRLFYGGKLLEDGYSFHDYNIKLNDVIQLMQKVAPPPEPQEKKDDSTGKEKEVLAEPSIQYEDATSKLYRIGDLIDVREKVHNAWFEGKVVQIVKDPEYVDETKPETNKSNVNGHMKDEKVSNSNETSCTKSPKKDSPKENTPVKEKETKHSSPVKENGLNNSINGHSSKTDSPKSCDSPKNRTTPKRGIKDYFSKEKVNGDVETVKGTKGKEEEKYNAQDKSEQIEKDSSGSENVNGKCNKMDVDNSDEIDEDFGLLYKIHFDEEEEGSAQYCKLSEIRPRARKEIKVEHLEVGQTVMLNYNTEESHEKGYWYDFTIQEIKKLRKNVELIGTLYHGKDIPLNDVKVKIHDKMFAIETVVPLSKRTGDYDKLMITPIEKRAGPLLCTKCRDDPETPCKDCGCNICAGKNLPDQIILCDECNQGFHMSCLTPPLEGIPEEDWYCSECKRDTNSVVAPGAKKQTRKPNQRQGRDWGRGMACVGKTQTCAMPANHFGPIPGIEVGMAWRFRIQLSESGVHRPPVSGIHGRDVEGAYSIVLSGGYEDDVDNGFEFTYTGSGGRDLSGNKRTADQSSDQTLTRENKALARNCAVKEVNEEGADSKDKWRDGRPVRVVRSYKMLKHFPEYAPKEGIRFDGIYKVVKYYPEKGKSGFRVWKYLLRRDDPNPAPWEKNGKTFPIVYPDGYLEAEAEKQAQKERQKSKGQKSPAKKTARKRPLRESNGNSKDDYSDDESDKKRKSKSGKESPPAKKMRTRSSLGTEKTEEKSKKINTPKRKATDKSNEKISSPSNANNPFTIAASKKSKVSNGANDSQSENASLEVLSAEDREGLEKDTVNKKLWDECLEALKKDGRKGLVDKVTSLFLCIICQEVAASPVTTNCSHNFCMACLKLAFQNTESNCCPYCRADLSKDEMNYNENLKTALRAVLPGYDLRRK